MVVTGRNNSFCGNFFSAFFCGEPTFKIISLFCRNGKFPVCGIKSYLFCSGRTGNNAASVKVEYNGIFIRGPDCGVFKVVCGHYGFWNRVPFIGITGFCRNRSNNCRTIINFSGSITFCISSVKIPCKVILISRVVIINNVFRFVIADDNGFHIGRRSKSGIAVDCRRYFRIHCCGSGNGFNGSISVSINILEVMVYCITKLSFSIFCGKSDVFCGHHVSAECRAAIIPAVKAISFFYRCGQNDCRSVFCGYGAFRSFRQRTNSRIKGDGVIVSGVFIANNRGSVNGKINFLGKRSIIMLIGFYCGINCSINRAGKIFGIRKSPFALRSFKIMFYAVRNIRSGFPFCVKIKFSCGALFNSSNGIACKTCVFIPATENIACFCRFRKNKGFCFNIISFRVRVFGIFASVIDNFKFFGFPVSIKRNYRAVFRGKINNFISVGIISRTIRMNSPAGKFIVFKFKRAFCKNLFLVINKINIFHGSGCGFTVLIKSYGIGMCFPYCFISKIFKTDFFFRNNRIFSVNTPAFKVITGTFCFRNMYYAFISDFVRNCFFVKSWPGRSI